MLLTLDSIHGYRVIAEDEPLGAGADAHLRSASEIRGYAIVGTEGTVGRLSRSEVHVDLPARSIRTTSSEGTDHVR